MLMAEAIEILAPDATEAAAMAEKRAIAKDQDWQNERTIYVFDDNSVLICSGFQFWAEKEVPSCRDA